MRRVVAMLLRVQSEFGRKVMQIGTAFETRIFKPRLLSPLCFDVILILVSTALVLAVITALGALGLKFGLQVFPIGEDNNWIDMLRRGGGSSAARLLWALDNRNPLSPWWYIAARYVVLNFDAGLLALSYGMSILLALSAYAMIVAVAGRQSRSFALAIGILIVFWMANRYTDQILWNLYGALCASLISVAMYAEFINGGRRAYGLYAASIVAWFIAFATYTIQCGAALAIAYVAIRQTAVAERDFNSRTVMRLRYAICDTAPYVVLFVLFLLIWQTTIGPGVVESISLKFSPAAFLASLSEGMWSADLAVFFARVSRSPDRLLIIAVSATCGLFVSAALRMEQRLFGRASAVIDNSRLVDVLVVVMCIAAPTIALESSSPVWTPGTRWPMIYKLTTPVLILAFGAFVLWLVSRKNGPRYRSIWIIVVGLAITIGEAFSLGHNQLQVEYSRSEKFIRDSLLRLVAENLALGLGRPAQVLLMLDTNARSSWRSSDILSPTIARVWFQTDDISFRLVPWASAPTKYWDSWWTVRFGSNSEGVGNAKVWGGTVPYEHITVLQIKERAAHRVAQLDRSSLDGWAVDWIREGPILLPMVDSSRLCPFVWTAAQEILAPEWSRAEYDKGGPFRRMSATSAHFVLPATCPSASILRFLLVDTASSGQPDRIRIWANQIKLPHTTLRADGNIILEVTLPPEVLARSVLEIRLATGLRDKSDIRVRKIEMIPPH